MIRKKRKKSYKLLAVYDKHNILPNKVIEQESRTQKKVKIPKNIIKRITYSYRVWQTVDISGLRVINICFFFFSFFCF